MKHFNVSYVRPGEQFPLENRVCNGRATLYIHNLKIAERNQNSLSFWKMSSDEARLLSSALKEAADHMDRVKPVNPVWEI